MVLLGTESRADVRNNLERHLDALEGVRNPFTAPEGHRQARAYVDACLGALGPVERQEFPAGTIQGMNLSLLAEGRTEGPAFLVGAHYDTVPGSPGADDNASGVAVMLEVARLCVQTPPAMSVIFAAFDLEERGPFGWGALGSRAMARGLRHEGQRLATAFSLEMVGVRHDGPPARRPPWPFRWFYPARSDFLLMLGNPWAGRWTHALGKTLGTAGVPTQRFTVPFKGWPVPSTRRSDHASFWDYGYSAVLLTDTAFLRSPHYHRPTDTKETLDFDFMAGITEGLFQFLQRAVTVPQLGLEAKARG